MAYMHLKSDKTIHFVKRQLAEPQAGCVLPYSARAISSFWMSLVPS